MEKTTIAILIISILALGLFAGFLGLSDKAADDNESDKKPADTQNSPYAEAFVFSLLDGGVKNTSEYSGKIVLLDFMGVNCRPCQSMMRVLKDLSENYKDQIEIVSIDVWIALGETPELLREFVDYYKENGVDLDWTFGYDDPSGTLFTKYASSGIPLVLVIDKDGNIYYTKEGYLDGSSDYAVLAEKIDNLIG